IRYLNAKGALTYTDIAGDPVLYGNLPPREISMKDVFRSGDSSKKFKIAEGQWYRYAPPYVSLAYHLLEGFPFIQEPPSGDLTFRHQLTILSKTDALDEEKWLNMLGTFVKDWFRYESHFVHGRDSLVDILKERGLLSESDAVQPLIGKKS